jgi:hypothetical protein
LRAAPKSAAELNVCGAFEAEASHQFIDARHRAERGETFHERHWVFKSWDVLALVLTGKREGDAFDFPVESR